MYAFSILRLWAPGFREDFLKEAKEFSQSYDLKRSGKCYREQQIKKKVTLLQAEILMLETGWPRFGRIIIIFIIFIELSEMESQKAGLRKLENELVTVEATFNEDKSHNEGSEWEKGLCRSINAL